jgi:hypothetical protein
LTGFAKAYVQKKESCAKKRKNLWVYWTGQMVRRLGARTQALG